MNTITPSLKQFRQLATLVYDTCGIHLHEGKQELVKSKLAKCMRRTKMDLKQYLEYLAGNSDEVIQFIDTMTTNHSFFFRENANIEFIVNAVAGNQAFFKRPVKIWSAACSTGDEPYSLAIQLDVRQINFSLLATDLSYTVLNQARKGIYKMEKTSRIPLHLLHRYFQKGYSSHSGYVRIKPSISERIVFRVFNLISDPPPSTRFDVILLRNVMIYFDQSVSQMVVEKLYHCLNPGGYFAIGNAESLMNLDHKFKPIKKRPGLYIK